MTNEDGKHVITTANTRTNVKCISSWKRHLEVDHHTSFCLHPKNCIYQCIFNK